MNKNLLIDSLQFYKHTVDSLKLTIENNKEWHGIRIYDVQFQAAAIIAFTTIITVFLGFAIKDFLIPWFIEKHKRKKNGQELFKYYKNGLFRSSESMRRRLYEIFEKRSHYLWENVPQNNFYTYKYKSSVYRLCVLLAWIRAYRLALPAMEMTNNKNERHKISESITKIESCLADGQGVEMYLAKSVCSIANVNIDELADNQLEKFSVGIDHIFQAFRKETFLELSEVEKDAFYERLKELAKKEKITDNITEENKAEIIKEFSIKIGLIYRDWQQAIGDLMLRDGNDGTQKYKIIGFKDFERIWDEKLRPVKLSDDQKWIRRSEKIFTNLDFRLGQNADSRINQLRLLYPEIYNLQDVLFKIKIGDELISKQDFKYIPKELPQPPV